MGLLCKGGLAPGARVTSLFWVAVTAVVARATMIAVFAPIEGLRRLEPSLIAANLNAGRGFTFEQYGAVYRAWKEPLYIVLLAWLTRWAGDSNLAVLLFQTFFGVGTAVGVALIARYLLGDPAPATLAGMIVAVNPFLIYYDTRFIHPLSMDAFLFVATVGTSLVAISQCGRGLNRTLLAGLVMGLALWQRATLLAAGAAVWVAAILFGGPHGRKQLARATVWLCVAVLAVSPWLFRSYLLFGRFVLTTDFAHVLWLGNNPGSIGTYSDMEGRRVFYLADPALQERIHGASELGQYDIFLGEVRRFVLENPEKFGALVLRRLWAYVWFSPNAGIEYAAWQRGLYRAAYTGLLSLGVLGFALYWRRATHEQHCRVVVLLSSVLGLAAVHALTAINLKHRVPLELVLAIFAAESISRGLALVRAVGGRIV